jgi:nitrate/nitrite transporter NarK
MLGPIGAIGNLGVCIGLVVGGLIVFGSANIQWIFWALVILGGAMTLATKPSLDVMKHSQSQEVCDIEKAS